MSDTSPKPQDTAPAPRWTLWIILSAVLVGASGAAFYYATQKAPKRDLSGDDVVTVTIRDKQCTPNDITVPAGFTTFKIVNQSDRALEWEILDGVMVIDERENIAPGFSQTMRVKLHPGQYEITCGLLSSPRGKLTVTPSEASKAEAARPPLTNFISALAEYQVFLHHNTEALTEQVQALANAVAAGHLKEAQAAYVTAHGTYKRLQSVAELFGDLDVKIDARATLFEKGNTDPAFTGFYRIAVGLFEQQDTKSVQAISAQLVTDVAALRQRIPTLEIWPERLAGGGSRLLRRIADNLVSDKEDPAAFWSQLQGAYDGTYRIATLLQPLVVKSSPELDAELTTAFSNWQQALAQGLAQSGAPDQAAKEKLAQTVTAVSDSLAKVNPALGLE